LMITLLILTAMGRPIFSQHPCIGLKGVAYMRWKFRTIEFAAPEIPSDASPRSNAASRSPLLGLMLRESGLDDLPQLINILCGYASFVGPQSPIGSFFSHYLHSRKDGQ
jgi:lipopolysaccharide/colanic/teichoic acid biosynthesis glycosyltransferase